MVAMLQERETPFRLVVTGQAEEWLPALQQIVGTHVLFTYKATSGGELLEVVESGMADAAVLDDAVDWRVDALKLLRMIRRVNTLLPVVVVSGRRDRLWMEDALRLAAFSVVARPLELEELLRQIQRMMQRIDDMLRGDVEP